MKIRNGFVSNSSSASFIVTWKTDDKSVVADNSTNSNRDILITVMKMFDLWDFEVVPQDVLFDFESFTKVLNKEEETFFGKKVYDISVFKYAWLVAKETKQIDCTQATKTFKTEFITCMFNNADSFGQAATYMMMNFYTKENDNFELIKAKIERD